MRIPQAMFGRAWAAFQATPAGLPDRAAVCAALEAAFEMAEVEMTEATRHPLAAEHGWPDKPARIYTARWVERD